MAAPISNIVSQLAPQGNYGNWLNGFKSPGLVSAPKSTVPMATSAITKQPIPGSITGTLAAPKSTAPVQGLIKPPVQTPVAAPIKPAAPLAPQSSGYQDPLALTPAQQANAKTPQQIAAAGAPQLPANVQSGTPDTSFGGIVSSLVNTSSTLNPTVTQNNQALQNYQQQTANALQTVSNTPGPLGNQLGREANINSTAALQEQALQTGITNSLKEQGLQQSGLTQAGQLAQPSPASYGQTVFNPLTGQYTSQGGGNNLDPQTQASTLAQQVISGQTSYDQAVSSMGYAGSAGTIFLNNAITQAGGNPLSLQAQGATTQSNIQTGGTAATDAAASGLQSATQNYVAANTAYTTAQNQSGNLQQTMASTGINSNPQFVNSKINTLQNQFGSTKYPAFITALNESKQAYTSLLSSVGAATPTVNGQQATDIFNENSTPQQINAAIDALNQAAYAKLQPLYQQIETYSSQLGGSGSSGSSGGSFDDASFYGKNS